MTMDTLQRRGTIPADQLQPVLRLFPRALRFWKVGVLIAVLASVAAAAVVMLMPKRYRSEAVVLYREGMQWRTDEGASPRRVGQRLKDILLARTQLTKLIEELGLFPQLVAKDRMPEAVEEMRTRTDFRFDQGDVFVLSYQGDTPSEAKRVTAKLTDVLILENSRLRSQQAELAREFLNSEKKRMEKEVADKEAAQLQFLARHPELAVEGAAGAARRSRSSGPSPAQEAALAALRRDQDRLRAQLMASGVSVAPPVDTGMAAVRDAEAKLNAARRDLADKRNRFTEQHPDVRNAFQKVAEAEAAFKAASERAGVSAPASTPVDANAVRDRLAKVEAEISRRERAAEGLGMERSESARLGAVAAEAEFARLTREVSEARERLQHLDTQQFTASMTASMVTSGQTAQIMVIDPANLPAQPAGMKPKKKAAFGVLAAFALGFLTMIILAVLDDLVYDRSDIERLEFAPVLGEVSRPALQAVDKARDAKGEEPRDGAGAPSRAAATSAGAPAEARPPAAAAHAEVVFPAQGAAGAAPSTSSAIVLGGPTAPVARGLTGAVNVFRVPQRGPPDPQVFMVADPEGAAAASFRVLRHRLRAFDPKVILVTSPHAGEGKTLTALNLALALGEGGRARVLLVEANPRSPCVARLLGFAPPVPFEEQLEKRRSGAEPWSVVETTEHWLHVAALSPRAAGQPFQAAALSQCLAELREAGYHHIVVDGPNVLDGADVNAIEESVDGVLLSLRTRQSRALQVRKVAEQIGFAKLLGVVLLGT